MADLKESLLKLKKVACDAIDASAKELAAISADIWSKPELAWEEKHAHDVLTEFLKKRGFQTERSYKLETAFRATYGSRTDGRPNITFISEYDALPEIGHACGHNLIAEVGIGAGIGLMAAMKAANADLGQVTVLGTPAEEGPGGKINLIDAGAFDDVDVAMMAHPFPDNDFRPLILARESIEVKYIGKASHAAAYPWDGVNALDAAFMCYQGLACLRQQIKPTWRIHCIVLEGGVKVNIIPEHTRLHIGIRAPTDRELAQLKVKVTSIIENAGPSTGCKVEHHVFNKPYSSMLHNEPMVQLYEANLASVQPEPVPTVQGAPCGSTDMGNVAHVVPSIHPSFHMGGRAVNHTRDFTTEAGAEKAQKYALNQAKTLAMIGVDIMLNKALLANIKDAFNADMATEKADQIEL